MAILVTNDDGYSKGLKILLDAAKTMDKTSYAIIPKKQQSAVSKAITVHKPIRIQKREKDLYEINGKPADCVTFSIGCKEFKKPKMVLSGINWGDNASLHSIYTSGTLAACVEATIFNIPSIGFSLYRNRDRWRNLEKHWGNGKKLSKLIVSIVKKLKKEFEDNVLFSVNFPDNYEDAEIKISNPQRHRYDIAIAHRLDPYKRPYYWISGTPSKSKKNFDLYDIENGNIVITPIELDPINQDKIKRLKKLFK